MLMKCTRPISLELGDVIMFTWWSINTITYELEVRRVKIFTVTPPPDKYTYKCGVEYGNVVAKFRYDLMSRPVG